MPEPTAYPSYGILIYDLDDQEGGIAVIKMSVRQGQLVEGINFSVLRLVHHSTDAKEMTILRSRLSNSISEFADSYAALVEGVRYVRSGGRLMGKPGELSDELKVLYYGDEFKLDRQVKDYLKAARAVLYLPDDELFLSNPDVSYILSSASNRLLAGLKEGVRIYQSTSEYQFRQSHDLQSITLATTLISLFFIQTFLLNPLLKKVKETMNKEFRENVLNTAQALIVGLGTDSRIIFFNSFAEETTGWFEEEIKGQDFFEQFIPPSEQGALRDLYAKVMTGDTEFENQLESPLSIRSEELLDIVWHVTAIKDPQTYKPIIFLATGLDITSRKLAEDRLQNALSELE